MSDKVILHCDCNNFFASVEEKLNPQLKGVPMAVTGDPENRHGIILAKNQLAKKYDIRTAEPIWQAKRKCPSLVCVPPHHDLYNQTSKEINKIYLEYTDLVEPFSIDESFLDVTNSLHLLGVSPEQLADLLRQRIKNDIGITISVGVSFCKTFAKFGSDYKKPDATTVISRDNLKDILYPRPVSELFMAGKKTTDKLNSMGIRTIGQLAEYDSEKISKILGKSGLALWKSANGEDGEAVRSYYEPREIKSVGNSMTFKRDLCGADEIRSGIALLADMVAGRLRADNLKGNVIQLGIRDPAFNTIQRQKTLSKPTFLQKEITEVAFELAQTVWNMQHPVRLLSVTVAGITDADDDFVQMDLFSKENNDNEKLEQIEETLSAIRNRFGSDSIKFGHLADDDTGIK